MDKNDISFLKQLIKSLEQSEMKLKKYHDDGYLEAFNEVKSLMLKIQKQINEIIK